MKKSDQASGFTLESPRPYWGIYQIQQILMTVSGRVEHGRSLSFDCYASRPLHFKAIQHLFVFRVGILCYGALNEKR